MIKQVVSFTEPQLQYLKREAKALGLSVSELVRRIIDEHRGQPKNLLMKPKNRGKQMGYKIMIHGYDFSVLGNVMDRQERAEYRTHQEPEDFDVFFDRYDVLDRIFDTEQQARQAAEHAYQGPNADFVGLEWDIEEVIIRPITHRTSRLKGSQ